MTIHREGYRILTFVFLFLAAVNVLLMIISPHYGTASYLAGAASVLFFLFTMLFFRFPRRSLVTDDKLVYAPADGKVVVIEEVFEGEYFKDNRIQVSIFMSPLNVHSNRIPVTGTVRYRKYHPGKYIVAWHPKSSDLNEHATVVIEREEGTEIMVRQIAGAMARRIVTYPEEGDRVVQGGELGFIKFGSRVDIFLPRGTTVVAPFNKQVRANRTVIATI
ncbi:MAG: phosphatidylserine decarboxylase family protein [Bacteroidales bacterium]